MARHHYMCELNVATGCKTRDLEERDGTAYMCKLNRYMDRKTIHAVGIYERR